MSKELTPQQQQDDLEETVARKNIQKQLLHFGLVDILKPLQEQYQRIASGDYNSKQARDLSTNSSAQIKVMRFGLDVLRLTKA